MTVTPLLSVYHQGLSTVCSEDFHLPVMHRKLILSRSELQRKCGMPQQGKANSRSFTLPQSFLSIPIHFEIFFDIRRHPFSGFTPTGHDQNQFKLQRVRIHNNVNDNGQNPMSRFSRGALLRAVNPAVWRHLAEMNEVRPMRAYRSFSLQTLTGGKQKKNDHSHKLTVFMATLTFFCSFPGAG